MLSSLLPLFVAPAILLPLAAYALLHRRVRGAAWYATLLIALSVWCTAYIWELTATGFDAKSLALKAKYVGVVLVPMAWLGFVHDFVAVDGGAMRRLVIGTGILSGALLLTAWTDGWHGQFWGGLRLEGTGREAVLIGRGPGFWVNIGLTYAALATGIAVLVSQAVASPYLYKKRAIIIVAAALIPWAGNFVFLAADERPGTVDLTPVLFSLTAVLAALAVFRYRVLDPIPTLRDVRIEVIGDGLVILDSRGRIADLNRAAERILGRTRAVAAGLAAGDLLDGLDWSSDTERRADIRRRVGTTERTFDASVTPIRPPSGARTGSLVLLRDVTERRVLEEQLRQAQKMEAVGKLAGGVAHDFNNLLTAIIGFSTLAEDDLPEDSPARPALAQVRRSAEQAASLTRQLLAFGRRQLLQPEPLDISDVVRQMEPMLRRLIGEDVAVTTEYGEQVPIIEADRTQLQQILLNLVVNARDAMPDGGHLTIRTGRSHASERTGAVAGGLQGEYVWLEVIDSGHGIAADTIDRIFEPFFTTKAFGQGTGLGLSTVYGIAKQSGGDVLVTSSPGKGATFRVLLPASAALRPAPSAAEPVEGIDSQAGTALLVEDDDAVREFVSEVLRAAGWTVVIAASPGEALAMAARQTLVIDVLVTDVVMPGMNGADLADRLVELRPQLRVLFITGYDDQEMASRGLVTGGRELLAKPFTPSQLRARIQAVVSAGTRS
jgi:two-component system cell cycle sensor histidine kinase/response regulator CckA